MTSGPFHESTPSPLAAHEPYPEMGSLPPVSNMQPVSSIVPVSSTDDKSQPNNVAYISIPKTSPPEPVQINQYSDQGLTFNQPVNQNQTSPQQPVQQAVHIQRSDAVNDPIGDLFPVTSQGKCWKILQHIFLLIFKKLVSLF